MRKTFITAALLTATALTPVKAQVAETGDLLSTLGEVAASFDKNHGAATSSRLLSRIQSANRTLKGLKQVGRSLAALDAAIGLFDVVTGAPSDTDLILNAIEDLSDQVETVRDTISDQEKRATLTMQYAISLPQLDAATSTLTSAYNDWNGPGGMPAIGGMQNLSTLGTEVDTLADLCRSDRQRRGSIFSRVPSQLSAMELIERYSYGHPGLVSGWAMRLPAALVKGQVAYTKRLDAHYRSAEGRGDYRDALAAARTMEPATPDSTLHIAERAAMDRFAAAHANCGADAEASVDRITSRKGLRRHVDAFAKRFVRTAAKSERTAKALGSTLAAYYPHREWVAVVYGEYRGYRNHYYRASRDTSVKLFDEANTAWGKNAVVHFWTQRTSTDPFDQLNRMNGIMQFFGITASSACRGQTCGRHGRGLSDMQTGLKSLKFRWTQYDRMFSNSLGGFKLFMSPDNAEEYDVYTTDTAALAHVFTPNGTGLSTP